MVRPKERWRTDRTRTFLDDVEIPERLAWPAAMMLIGCLSLLLWSAVWPAVVWIMGW